MPSLMYGTASYERETGNLPRLTLINMFVEQAATSENSACLQSRPGLGLLATNGSGPINAIYSGRGVLSGDDFSVSGSTLYRGTTSKGTVTGSGFTTIAGAKSEILIARGGTLYSYNGSTLASSGFTGNASNNVTSVCYINSRFVALEANSARFYWSGLLDGRSWDALDFATAERQPDNLLDIASLGDNIWLFGQQSVEVWQNDGVTPFSRIEQVAFDKGIIATGALCKADNSLFFAGSDARVYRASADVPERVSDHWLEEKVKASTIVSMFSFVWEGHEFVCVRLDSNTFAYDCATKAWCELQTSGGQWIAGCAAMKGTSVYLGHDSTGKIMGFSEWDDLGAEMTREFTAAVQMDAPGSVDNLWVWANAGQTPLLTGQGSDPVMEMESSRDAGNTWTSFDSASLGAIGGYRVIPEWRRLGQYDAPGAMFRLRVTDPVPFRVSAVKYNEPLGGRSRN
jgi:hypothetical protein